MNQIKRIGLRFSYIGRNYHGLALNKDKPTIAEALIKALKKCKIFCSNPTFCGRTDTGVNAKNMVASLDINIYSENINYVAILNSHLPKDIKITGYAFLEDFNARYDCIQRHYKYFFTEYHEKMEWVVDKLRGVKNFKSLCRKTNGQSTCKRCRDGPSYIDQDGIYCACKIPTDYSRNIDSIEIKKSGDLYFLDIKARSFLHNMIRKIYWLIISYATGRVDEFFVEVICSGEGYCGTEKAENLVFCCAKYDREIEWVGYRVRNFDKERRKSKIIEFAIDKYIYDY